MTSGDREEEDRAEMEKAMLDNFEINEQKRNNAAKLIERNLGTYYEGENQNYIHTLQQQSTSSSSNAPMIQLVETKPDIKM